MNNVVSLNQWKSNHPDEVIIVLYDYMTVKFMSPDYRTMYKCTCVKRELTQREFDTLVKSFKEEYPAAKIVDIINHAA